ncbi:MAG TPA: GTPase HflX, partial [Ohtaekwangia sp.]
MEDNSSTAVLVALNNTRKEETDEHLDELAFLAETSGIKTVRRFVQNLPHPDHRFFLGKGK